MAAVQFDGDNLSAIDRLRLIFGCISEEDCKILIEEFGQSTDDIEEITVNVYEAVETSRYGSVNELLWHIKQNPTYDRRSNGIGNEKNSRNDSWNLARSKSSNSVNKNVSAAGTSQPMPYSSTRNPVQIQRTSKTVDPNNIKPYLTNLLQDTELRSLIYDVYENHSPKLLLLLRGASGSGKSTLAACLWAVSDKGEVCSADHYFMNRNGIYKFNRASLSAAHESCRNHCKAALTRGDSPIMIDNTNTKVEEMMPYVQMAMDYNYEIRIVEPKTEWKTKPSTLAQKNIHGVPKRSIEDQLERFEKTTVTAMIDRVLKCQGHKSSNYKPLEHLDWGLPQATEGDPWATPERTSPPTSGITNMMSALSAPAAPIKAVPFLWSEPPQTKTPPPSPLLLSDLVPDLKRGSNGSGGKPKRAAKRAGNGNPIPGNSTPVDSVPSPPPAVAFEDPAHLAFEKLRKLFPTVPYGELERIFNLYEGDVDLCASALMEDGMEMTGTLFSEPEQETNPVSNDENMENLWVSCNNQESPTNDDPPNGSISNSSNRNGELCGNSSTLQNNNPVEAVDNETDVFEMVLPTEFARFLLCMYGHPEDEERQLSVDLLTVKVPADAAFEIYKSLYLNMHKAEIENGKSAKENGRVDRENTRAEYGNDKYAPSQSSSRSSSPVYDNFDDDEFTAIAISLSQMELETNSGDPQLAAIIDLEAKLTQQTQEAFRSYSVQNRTMAQNINFSMLKQEYPFLDTAVIDEVYTQCLLNIDKARLILNDMYPQSAAKLQESKPTSVANSSWQLMYNPKDVQLYSSEDLKTVQKKYNELERDWQVQMEKIKSCHEKCKATSNPQIRSHYFNEARTLSTTMKTVSDEMQYYKALCINAKHKNDQILDLHGLQITGAMRVLKEFLQYKEEEFLAAGIPKMILLIITGQGKHSKNRCPVLQPAVRNFLAQRKYRYHSGKPGSYTVILTKGAINKTK